MKNHCQKPWITWLSIWPTKAIASQSSQNIYRLTSLIRIHSKSFDSSQLYTNITASINRSITNRPIRHHTDSILFTRISLDGDIPVSRNQRKNIVIHANNSLFAALNLIVHLKYLRPVNTLTSKKASTSCSDLLHWTWKSTLDLQLSAASRSVRSIGWLWAIETKKATP